MTTLYGYIRTSRQKTDGEAGSDPETQRLQLIRAGVDPDNIYRDVGVSGSTGTNTRNGWRLLNSHLDAGDVLVVASVDRVGRHWMNTINTIRDLRNRQVRLRSLAATEESWTRYLDADPNTPEAMIGDILASVFTWASQQELDSIKRRTRAGLERARAAGKTLGPRRKMTDLHVATARRLSQEDMSDRKIAAVLNVGRSTVRRYLAGTKWSRFFSPPSPKEFIEETYMASNRCAPMRPAWIPPMVSLNPATILSNQPVPPHVMWTRVARREV